MASFGFVLSLPLFPSIFTCEIIIVDTYFFINIIIFYA